MGFCEGGCRGEQPDARGEIVVDFRTASLMSVEPAAISTKAGVSWLPVVELCRNYKSAWFRADLIAGLTVCVVMIPSVLAYAELAGVRPVLGLYAALTGMIGFALFTSSR